ncbi:MAG: polysaccharide export protein [Bacteroidales bacterium]|nr:polysaccharide export protein [Bacteroidales bacterium]
MKLKTLAIIFGATLALASCSSRKSTLPYFNDIITVTEGTLPAASYLPEIQPDDELLITVSSANPAATALYNLPMATNAPSDELSVTGQARQLTYFVDSQGDITMPQLGKIHVAGMTTEQLQAELTKMISRDVRDPMVVVRLMNFTVSVGGEVRSPKSIKVPGNRITVLEALAAAGDMTEYGQRSNVLVIREENGERTFAHLDLNSAEALASPYYYLQQNDYVYVAPNSIRQANSKYNTNNSFKLQVTSTIVSAVSVIASLIIALTR